MKVSDIFSTLTELMRTPNASDALDAVKANVYSDDKARYETLACEHTAHHASETMEELKKRYQIED